MTKRVLIFSTAYFPFVGGAEVAVREIADRLSDFEFVMITARLDAKLPIEQRMGKVVVYRIGKGDKWDKFRLIWSGWKKARELGSFNMVWSIMASYAGFAALRYKKRNPTVPFLLTLQEGDSRWDIYKHVWWCWPYFKQIFKRADKIQAISNYLAKWAKDLGAKCPIEVVPNGVNLDKFLATLSFSRKRESSGRLFQQSEINIKESDKIVITVSRLVKKNGVGDLIKAMQFLNDDVHLLVLGSGELEFELKSFSKQSNLDSRVHFLGNINQDELPKYLWAGDVFCRPSLSEGLGIAFLEALAAGLPVVAPKIGGIPDFLQDGETGLFCEIENPKDIAEKINIILDDQELKNKLVANGKKVMEEKYNWELIADKMKKIFNNLCVS